LVIALIAAGWMASGHLDLNATEDANSAATNGGSANGVSVVQITPPDKAQPKLAAVRARVLHAIPRVREIVARGRTEASRRVDIKAETPGRIIAIGVKKGARVAKGDVLVRIEAGDRLARLREAKALVQQRQIEYDAAKQLQKKGFRADTQVAGAAAALDAAKAQVKRMSVDISRLTIHAPFDGVVDVRPVEIGDWVDTGHSVSTIVDDDPLLVVAQVSEREVGYLSLGDRGTATLVTGEKVTGTVRYIATVAEGSTRTFRVEREIDKQDAHLRDGVTTEMRISIGEIYAHLVTPAVLTLNDAGIVGVRTVNDKDRVDFRPVNVVGTSNQGVWLTGLPPTVTVITVGQEFVRQGDQVKVVIDKEEPTS
jgi:multidrug efflux system membrane fusion protein